MREANHTGEFVDPASDAETIMTELILADIQTLEKQLPKLEKEAKRDAELAPPKLAVAKRLVEWLNEGNRAITMEMTDEERAAAKGLFLLTMKPMLYVANVDEDMLTEDLDAIDGVKPIPICAKVEAELSELDPEEAAEFLADLGLERSGLEVLAQAAYKLLGLQSFFTAGEVEVRAWTVRQGATAPQAAGVIHTDFERGFIKAETIAFEELRRPRRREERPRKDRPPAHGGQGLHHAGRRRGPLPLQRVDAQGRRGRPRRPSRCDSECRHKAAHLRKVRYVLLR